MKNKSGRCSGKGQLFRSRWDKYTWIVVCICAATCFLPAIFNEDGIIPVIISVVSFLLMISILLSVYYRIEDNKLVVYQFFRPSYFPIDNISEICRVKTYLTAPAASFTKRIGIKFSDQSILKSTLPLVISPEKENEFIAMLKSINPAITLNL